LCSTSAAASAASPRDSTWRPRSASIARTVKCLLVETKDRVERSWRSRQWAQEAGRNIQANEAQ
jgi:hypothetical protein